MGIKLNLSGQIFGKLTVLKESGRTKDQQVLWSCKCQCGKIATVRASSLKSGITASCGCLRKDWSIKHKTKHGHARIGKRTSEYGIWQDMRKRCYKTYSSVYRYYGGRGVRVCDRWFNSFENFFADMGVRPTSKHSIDRINNNGNYEPSNCRWATQSEQVNNSSRTIKIIIYGITYSIKQASELFEIKHRILYDRLRRGWEPHEAIFTP